MMIYRARFQTHLLMIIYIFQTEIGSWSNADLILFGDCAVIGSMFLARTEFLGPAEIVRWKRSDIPASITLTFLGQTSCTALSTVDYDTGRYSFECNRTLHEYSMIIQNVTQDDLFKNWTMTVSTTSATNTSTSLFVDRCTQGSEPEEKDNGNVNVGLIVGCAVGGIVFLVIVFIMSYVIVRKVCERLTTVPVCNCVVEIETGKQEPKSCEVNAWINLSNDSGEETGKLSLRDAEGTGFMPGERKIFNLNAVAIKEIDIISLGFDVLPKTIKRWYVETVTVTINGKAKRFTYNSYIANTPDGMTKRADN